MFGCDTFVVFPPLTESGAVIFGKNSDRPQGEVQEIVYFPKKEYNEGDKLTCTYIEIDQVGSMNAVLLSKPAWMWGAEMGANDAGVVIGNEAVHTKLSTTDDEKLLGMDLVRLGLERGGSASEALDVITSLLEKHGQGGPCSDSTDLNYHNSFLIADHSEAWVLETAGHLWAAQKITQGFRNISNCLSIGTEIDKMSENLKSYAIENNLWNGEGDFNFKEVFSDGGSCPREDAGRGLLEKLSSGSSFKLEDMFAILRDTESGICRPASDPFHTASSQVSVLYGDKPCTHWMTGTPDPSVSIFKPFVFTPNVKISRHTISPVIDNDPAKTKPRFATKVDRRHNLYALHEAAVASKPSAVEQLRSMELTCASEMQQFVDNPQAQLSELDELLKDIVETEVKFYK